LDTHTLETLCLFLLIVVALFAGMAKRLNVPYPILLVLAGLGISLVPHVPRIPLNPDLVFNVFLPPLLYAAAWQTNWREFRRNIVSISMLAVGLVGFTVLGIAFFADHFITALDFKSGFLLGAVVAATDAVAATSIARSLGLSPRVTGLLEGESLLNDATGLLALEFGLALLLNGTAPSITEGSLRLVWLIAGGIGTGLLLGYIMTFVERWISDGPLEMAVSIIVPYVAYLAAEQVRASAVLAVVACGLFLSRRSTGYLTAGARLEIMSAWKALDFVLNGVVFVLIGLQLPYILAGIRGYSVWTLLLYGVAFSAVLIVLRMVWMFPGAYVSAWIRRVVFRTTAATPPPKKDIFVVGWTGMRGVVSLAAALSLPTTLSDGTPFEQRNMILFLTFSIIFVTLVMQGLSLPPLIRWLGIGGNVEEQQEELTVRFRVLSAAIASIEKARTSMDKSELHDVDDLLHRYKHRLEAITVFDRLSHSPGTVDEQAQATSERHQRRSELIRQTIAVERRTLLEMRDDGSAGDDVLRRLERELDLTETRYETRD
jgi:CPA1 family monovalent cation:H+ antiporter